MDLTHSRVKSLFSYDPETGFLSWIQQRGRQRAGARAGRLHHRGYREVRIDGVLYREHRIIWLWMMGSNPADECEHINRERSDNRWANLRAATRAQNMQNLGASAMNTSGFAGASFHKARGKWRSTITFNGRSIHLGHFDTAEEAHIAYLAAKQHLHPFYRATPPIIARSLSPTEIGSDGPSIPGK